MEWNVIVTVSEQGYPLVCRLLEPYGRVEKSDFFNVLVMEVGDMASFLQAMRELFEAPPPELSYVGRIVPISHRFRYQSAAEFEVRAREVVAQWLDALAGRRFYVRMHRRGFKGRISSQQEETFLDGYILEALAARGDSAARVDIEGAERVIALETLGQEAGLSLWSRDELERYPFLKLQ